MGVYAVIHTGGKQYRVAPGDRVRVEKLSAEEGDQIELDQVYLLAHDGQIFVGNPVVQNARVKAEVIEQKRDKKLIIFKHRRRKGYRNTTGHRQDVTALRIIEIVHDGVSYRPLKKADAGVASAAALKKPLPAKQQAAAQQKPEKKPINAAKTAAAAPALLQPEKPKPVEQNAAPDSAALTEAASKEPAARTFSEEAPATPKQEPKTHAAPSKEWARPMTAATQKADEFPDSAEAAEMPAAGAFQDKRKRWNIIGAVIIALALLGLLLFVGRDRPAPGPTPPLEMSKEPATTEPVKPKPPVREVKTRETAPVDKPSAPAQPPD